MSIQRKRFRLAFSFSGEKREFVATAAAILAKKLGEAAILYDKYHEAEFAHANLGFTLPNLYYSATDLVVAVFCKDYAQKEWCGLEWRAIHALIKEGKVANVMLCRFDHVSVEGLYSNAGYVELDHREPAELTSLILDRLRSNGVDVRKRKASAIETKPCCLPKFITNNLPRLQYFFGRERELAVIADALSPERRTWGALIDGPGGMGKTSLAIRAAELASPERFSRILFLSAKERELTPAGERPRTAFVLPGYVHMLNEIAALLEVPKWNETAESARERLILAALAKENALLILDNLEGLSKDDLDLVYTLLGSLPHGCKAIVTSRRRTDIDARIIRLEKLDRDAALAYIRELAIDRPLLNRASPEEHESLYIETGGNPLVIRWLAGQLGRGKCRNVGSALNFLRSSPQDNDPLEYIFGDLLDTFSGEEMKVLVALTYFAIQVEVKIIAELSALTRTAAETALEDLADRALVIADAERKIFILSPLVAEFLRRKRPELVTEAGKRLESRAYTLIMENGFKEYDRFPILDAAWRTISPALPIFAAGSNSRLQSVFSGLQTFLNFTGRWDELLLLSQQAETCALKAGDFENAGWGAYQEGWVWSLYSHGERVLECAGRALSHWEQAVVSPREMAVVIRLRGTGFELLDDHTAAIEAYGKSIDMHLEAAEESVDVAAALNALAVAEQRSGDLASAEKDFGEALRVAIAVGDAEGIAIYRVNLVELALIRGAWRQAELLGREALPLAEALGRQQLIGLNCLLLAKAIVAQEMPVEGLQLARRAVEIFTKLGAPELAEALRIVAQYE